MTNSSGGALMERVMKHQVNSSRNNYRNATREIERQEERSEQENKILNGLDFIEEARANGKWSLAEQELAIGLFEHAGIHLDNEDFGSTLQAGLNDGEATLDFKDQHDKQARYGDPRNYELDALTKRIERRYKQVQDTSQNSQYKVDRAVQQVNHAEQKMYQLLRKEEELLQSQRQ